MDPIEHASIPTIAYLSFLNPGPLNLIMLILGSVFPDFDVFAKEHRSYLHSLLFLIPLALLSLLLPWLKMFAVGVAFHLALDAFSGVVPFLYPWKRKGYGLELIVRMKDFQISISARIVSGYPTPKIERTLKLNRSIPLGLLTLALIIKSFS
ncbi:metal-dependent hydrolase [Pyrococcus kukulkanii]|uniref:metal-dependent hydrolase n=1 Tax=Pyrococcus kukulkanii TaxID=1609559 RepID=UPI00356A03F3